MSHPSPESAPPGGIDYVAVEESPRFVDLKKRHRSFVWPLTIAFLSKGVFAPRGEELFVRLVENLYFRASAPLLALFFACMLVGEDVETHTIHYVLTRPVPRSAWVVGKFLGYCALTLLILVPSLALTFAAWERPPAK